MATFSSDTRGGIDDRVRITLGDLEAEVIERYTVKQSFFTQPSAFALAIGHRFEARELLERFPPGTPYALSIGDVLQQTGRVEGQEASGDANGSSVTLTGRDRLADLVGSCIAADRSFTSKTYSELARTVIAEALGPDASLLLSNTRNRTIQVGSEIIESDLPVVVDSVDTGASGDRPMRAKAGDPWYKFLREQLDRAGLFLLSSAKGDVIMTAPNASQSPIARIVHYRRDTPGWCNVKSFRYRNDVTERFSSCVVHAKASGGKTGVQLSGAERIDEEMLGWGISRPLVVRDSKCATAGKAEALAKRKIAESRRSGWSLSYTLAGHTTPRIDGRDRVVWAVDTVVEVDDRELGISGPFWVESVEFSRGPQSETVITLMRPEDLVFGGESE